MYAKPVTFLSGPARTGRRGRTAARVMAAFAQLLATRSASDIAVSELAERCGLARSTVYRIFAGPLEMVWELAWPIFDEAFRQAVRGSRLEFVATMARLWDQPGLVRALADPAFAPDVRAKLAALATARIERRTRGRDFDTCGTLIAASCIALLSAQAQRERPDDQALSELMSVLYIAAFLTPDGVDALAREQAKALIGRGLPPAVSIAESLASPDYILSMVDGRPYRSLTRHLARYNLTPDEYRAAFELPADYPMNAPSYTETRRRLAHAQFARGEAGRRTLSRHSDKGD